MSPYEFFRDQGSIIAGGLALIAGYWAYRAGQHQANETRRAADDQIGAMREVAENADMREKRNLAHLLSAEIARIKMEAEFRLQLVSKHSAGNPRDLVSAAMREPFKIRPREILVSGNDMPNLLEPETCDALIGVLAAVDVMNSQLEIRTQMADYHWDDFSGALFTVGRRADSAMKLLSQELREG